jgi:hypothetical protein
MNLDDLTPAGGGSLRGAIAPPAREPVATFTPTSITHPDLIWSPRGGELAPPQRPLSQPIVYETAPSDRETMGGGGDTPTRDLDFNAPARMVRAAVRPGR